MSSRNMCLLPRATLHSDSEQYLHYLANGFLANFCQSLYEFHRRTVPETGF
jgi:hypothetical protein